MPKRRYTPRTEAQKHATMVNFCLRSLAGLAFSFNKAGHYDFEMLTKDLDAKFRAKLKGMKR